MSIDPERWTNRTREAFSAATTQATAAGNPEVTPSHVVAAVLAQSEGIAAPLLRQVGADPTEIARRVGEEISALPRNVGGSQPSMSRALREGLEEADTLRTEMGDEYVSIEHVLLVFSDELGVKRDVLLAALREVRGSHRVTSQTPEDTFQSLEKYARDLTALAAHVAAQPEPGIASGRQELLENILNECIR